MNIKAQKDQTTFPNVIIAWSFKHSLPTWFRAAFQILNSVISLKRQIFHFLVFCILGGFLKPICTVVNHKTITFDRSSFEVDGWNMLAFTFQ